MPRFSGELLKKLGESLLPFLVDFAKKFLENLGSGAPGGAGAAPGANASDDQIQKAVEKTLSAK